MKEISAEELADLLNRGSHEKSAFMGALEISINKSGKKETILLYNGRISLQREKEKEKYSIKLDNSAVFNFRKNGRVEAWKYADFEIYAVRIPIDINEKSCINIHSIKEIYH